LAPINPLHETPHPIPPQFASESYIANQITKCVFTQARSKAEVAILNFNVCLALKSRTVEPVSVHPNQVSADQIRILKIRDWRLPAKFVKYRRRWKLFHA
jgi:hypothetical protein